MRNKKWLRLLAYVTGSVNQELLLQNEYLAAENRILRAKLPSRLGLNDPDRATLAEIGRRVGAKRFERSPASPSLTPSWPGIEGSSPGSSTVPNTGDIQAAPPFNRTWKLWWCEWRVRILAGDMTASSERWPIWVTACPIRRWETFCDATALLRLQNEARQLRGGILSPLI